jgi:hypothetical protein
MSAPIGPGDWVEALIDCDAEFGFGAIVKGSVYCVESLSCGPGDEPCSSCGSVGPGGLILKGDAPHFAGTGWCPCAFRPIYRPRADLIRSLKQPAPDRELETT